MVENYDQVEVCVNFDGQNKGGGVVVVVLYLIVLKCGWEIWFVSDVGKIDIICFVGEFDGLCGV